MICVNCGKVTNSLICECCGTDYRTDEEKNKPICEHLYDSLRRDYDWKTCSFYLNFKCCKCNKILTVPTTKFIFDDFPFNELARR